MRTNNNDWLKKYMAEGEATPQEETEDANPDYQAILTLADKLTSAGIPYILRRLFDGWILEYPGDGEREGDVVEHHWSYGHEEDLMESSGFFVSDVQGYLSVDAAFNLFKAYHIFKTL